MDVTHLDAMAQLCRSIHDRWGALDIWVHTAVHAAPLTPATWLDQKDWERSVAVNVTTTGYLIPFIAPLLGENGRALFFEDDHAGRKFYGSYGATKAAQIALARSWQAETVRTGPKVHILQPGPMPTAVRARFHPGENSTGLADPAAEAARLLAEI